MVTLQIPYNHFCHKCGLVLQQSSRTPQISNIFLKEYERIYKQKEVKHCQIVKTYRSLKNIGYQKVQSFCETTTTILMLAFPECSVRCCTFLYCLSSPSIMEADVFHNRYVTYVKKSGFICSRCSKSKIDYVIVYFVLFSVMT